MKEKSNIIILVRNINYNLNGTNMKDFKLLIKNLMKDSLEKIVINIIKIIMKNNYPFIFDSFFISKITIIIFPIKK